MREGFCEAKGNRRDEVEVGRDEESTITQPGSYVNAEAAWTIPNLKREMMPSIDPNKLASSATLFWSLALANDICAEISVLPLIRYIDSIISPLTSYVLRFRKASADSICFRGQATVWETVPNSSPIIVANCVS